MSVARQGAALRGFAASRASSNSVPSGTGRGGRLQLGTAGPRRSLKGLEGDQSPWKDRASHSWQRLRRRDGLVSGARPCSRLLCGTSDGPERPSRFGGAGCRRTSGSEASAAGQPRHHLRVASRCSGGPAGLASLDGGSTPGRRSCFGAVEGTRVYARRRFCRLRPTDRTTRTVTWGSASADRSITASDVLSRSVATSRLRPRCRLGATVTARRQRPQ
jgi:hypothetical protein